MQQHKIEIMWERGNEVFTDLKYSRRHLAQFDGGLRVPFSSSPNTVRPPMSDPLAVDPEEALLTAVASCHMLWFLAIAAQHGFRVDSYHDQTSGTMRKNEKGKLFVSDILLKPRVVFSGDKLPGEEEHLHLHHLAHEECFIAHSVLAKVVYEPEAHYAE